MTENWTNEVILEFLELYEKYPVIWNPQNENNKNRRNVADAWNEIKTHLSDKYTVDALKKKKESLMAIYRFNKKKIIDSLKPGAGTSVYNPTWFAFPIMDRFLRNVGKRRQTIIKEDIKSESNDGSIDHPDASELETEETNLQNPTPMVKSKRKSDSSSSFGLIENNVKKTCDALQTQEKHPDKPDECDIYGQLFASKLRSLPKRSRLYLINQIDNLIFKAQLKEMDSDPLEN